MRGGDVDLGGQPRPGAAQRGDLERGDGHVGDGGPGLEAAGKGITGTPSARAISASRPPVVTTIRFAPSAPADS